MCHGWWFHAVASPKCSQGLVGFAKGLGFAKALRKLQLSQGSLRCCSSLLQGLWGADSGSLTQDECLSCAATLHVAAFLLAMLCAAPHCISNRGFWLGGILLDFLQIWIKQQNNPCHPSCHHCWDAGATMT